MQVEGPPSSSLTATTRGCCSLVTDQFGVWLCEPVHQDSLEGEPRESNLWRSPSPQINHGSTFLKGMKAGRLVLAHCLILVCNEESRAGDSRGGVCLPRQKVCVWKWTGHMRKGFRVSGAPSPSQRCSWMNTRRGVQGNYQGTL